MNFAKQVALFSAIAEKKAQMQACGHRVCVLENDVVDISSTQLYTHMINQKLKSVYEKCHPKA